METMARNLAILMHPPEGHYFCSYICSIDLNLPLYDRNSYVLSGRSINRRSTVSDNLLNSWNKKSHSYTVMCHKWDQSSCDAVDTVLVK